MARFKVLYNDRVVDIVEVKFNEINNYKRVLKHNLPKATLEEIKEEPIMAKKGIKTAKK